MDAATHSDATVAPVARDHWSRASVWVGGSSLVSWALGVGVFLVAAAIRDAPDGAMTFIIASVCLSVCLALAGAVLATVALLRGEGGTAIVGLGLSLLGVLLVYAAPALGIVAGGLLSNA